MSDPSIGDPMTFAYLDMMANILLNETVELQKEFDQKTSFIKNQERVCMDNGNELTEVGLFVDSMKTCLLLSEIELQKNEEQLVNLEKLVSRFEKSNRAFPTRPTMIPLKSNGYLEFLELMLSADQSAAQSMKLTDEVEAYNREMSARLVNPTLVTKIMDYHAKALSLLEKQIDKLNRELIEVIKWHNRIVTKIENKLTKKYTTCPK